MPLGDVAIALMAGNGVVLKPSPLACLCGERIGARVRARGPARGAAADRPRRRRRPGRALVESPVDQVRLTGSAEVGREVGEACARALQAAATLALAGKDAVLVLADAPLERAIARRRRGARSPTPARPAGRSSARTSSADVFDRFLAGVVDARARRCASATRSTRRPRSGR